MVSNAHGLMAYVPEHRLLIQGDLFDRNREIYYWIDAYQNSLDYRGITVERDIPAHGTVTPNDEVHRIIAEQIANARPLCEYVDAAGLSMPGCPLA